VALGPNPTFQSNWVGTVTRRVLPGQVVNAVPLSRRKARPPKRARIVETLRKAIEWRCQLDAGEVPNQAAIARREGLTRARVTQIMGLLRLAPEIRETILSVPETAGRQTLTERAVRPIAQLRDGGAQRAKFAVLFGDAA
jgi:hypothetical protein